MIVEFLGQGLHLEEDETCGNHVCSAIKDKSFTQITIFVAFLRKPGLDYLAPFIKQARKENRNVTFYVGIDERVTSKEALELLLELDTETYIYYSDSYIYHPKIYLFEGDRNRIITGSSNLTKSGLFYNVESSILLDFTNSDTSGLKIINQLKEFYSSFFDFSDPNLELLTSEYLDKLVLEDKVSSEEFSKGSDYNSNIHDNSKKRGRNPKITDLGNLEIKEKKPIKKYQSILKITEDYLAKWDYMFKKMEVFYKENDHCTVPREYKDRTLHGWYRKQKQLFNAGILPKEHLEKFLSFATALGFRTEAIYAVRLVELNFCSFKEKFGTNLDGNDTKLSKIESIFFNLIVVNMAIPRHPKLDSFLTKFSSFVMMIRGHFKKMPLKILIPHISVKVYRGVIKTVYGRYHFE